jgi:hypothetical protein
LQFAKFHKGTYTIFTRRNNAFKELFMKKMQSVAGILLTLTLVLALTACEQSTSSDPVDYGEAPLLNM